MSAKDKLNIGCGENYLEGYTNVDLDSPETTGYKKKPDLIWDITLKPLPIADNSIDEILCSHNIEHIKYELWPRVLYDFHRVLKVNGLLLLTYPEFEVCSKFFLENHRGLRDFWRACLYGRQAWAGDYHVTPVVSSDLAHHLTRNGFDRVMWTPEPVEVQNTIMRGLKSSTGVRTREDVIRETFYEEVQK